MTISPDNLKVLKACAADVERLRGDLHVAQLDLRHAIGMTYLEDHAPMREIAEAAGVSYQRVAQILSDHVKAGR